MNVRLHRIALLAAGTLQMTATEQEGSGSTIGRELAVPTHIRDGQELSDPLGLPLAHGNLLFEANWTE